jgi:hypothetical protein
LDIPDWMELVFQKFLTTPPTPEMFPKPRF